MDELAIMPKVKDCPFCHCDDIVVENVHGEYVWVCQNDDCIATGPYDEYEDRATEKWNARPIEDELRANTTKLEHIIDDREEEIAHLKTVLYIISCAAYPVESIGGVEYVEADVIRELTAIARDARNKDTSNE